MVVNYLRQRLGIRREEADLLGRVAFRAVRAYLREIDPENLRDADIDSVDVKIRLDRPYVFGHFAAEVLEDGDIPERLKERVMMEAYSSIDFEAQIDEMFPAYLLTILSWMAENEGVDREIVDLVLIAFDVQPEVLAATDPSVPVRFLRTVIGSGLLSDREVSLLLGVLLTAGTTTPDVARELVRAYLNTAGIDVQERRRFVAALIDDGYARRFWSDRMRTSDLIESHEVQPRDDILPVIRPDALTWLCRNADIDRELERYLAVRTGRPGAAHKYRAALRIVSHLGAGLPEDTVRRAIEISMAFPDAGLRDMAMEVGRAVLGEGFVVAGPPGPGDAQGDRDEER